MPNRLFFSLSLSLLTVLFQSKKSKIFKLQSVDIKMIEPMAVTFLCLSVFICIRQMGHFLLAGNMTAAKRGQLLIVKISFFVVYMRSLRKQVALNI